MLKKSRSVGQIVDQTCPFCSHTRMIVTRLYLVKNGSVNLGLTCLRCGHSIKTITHKIKN